MSFGYSAADFLMVVELAYRTWERCRNATSEFRDLGRDVANAHLVLRTVHGFWDSEEKKKRPLLQPQVMELREYAESCKKVLEEVSVIRDKHSDLDNADSFGARVKSRTRYVVKDFIHGFRSVRDRLQQYTSNLAIFHTMLTADVLREATDDNKDTLAYLKQQADIMKTVVTTYQDFQEGKRAEPAYSQVSRTANAEEQTAQAIAAAEQELQEQGIDKAALKDHRDLIKEWLEVVILSADAEENQDEQTVVDSDSALPLDTVAVSAGRDAKKITVREPARKEDIGTPIPGSGVDRMNPPDQAPRPVTVKRSASISTHRSQESTWKPTEASQSDDYAAWMILKVLRSKYPPFRGNEPFELPLKRAFHHLDPTSRGWLARKTVEQKLLNTAIRMGIPLEARVLAAMIKSEDEKEGRSDFRIDVDEFINIVQKLREYVCTINESLSQERGLQLAEAQILSWQDSQEIKAVSTLWNIHRVPKPRPYNRFQIYQEAYQSTAIIPTILVYEHQLAGTLLNGNFPLSNNTTNALYLGTNYCVHQIDAALSGWQNELVSWPQDDKREVFEALDKSLEIAAIFDRYEPNKGNSVFHWLDEFIETAYLVPYLEYENLRDCPAQSAVDFRKRLWDVLTPLLSIVSDVKDCGELLGDPALLLKWREKRLFERAQKLHELALDCLGDQTASNVEAIQRWVEQNDQELHDCRSACLNATKELRGAQELEFELLQSFKLGVSFRFGSIPKAHFFRRPTTKCILHINGAECKSPLIEKKGSPFFYSDLSVKRGDIVKGYFYIEKKPAWGLMGFTEFKVKEKVDLARGAPVRYSTSLDGAARGFTSVSIEVRLEPQDLRKLINENAVQPLTRYILSRPLTDGWKVRRHEGVYFCRGDTERTAILWCDPFTDQFPGSDLVALPQGWRKIVRDGKLWFVSETGEYSETPPPPDGDETFQNVLLPRTFDVVQSFGTRTLPTAMEGQGNGSTSGNASRPMMPPQPVQRYY